jgi:hypothetical protein
MSAPPRLVAADAIIGVVTERRVDRILTLLQNAGVPHMAQPCTPSRTVTLLGETGVLGRRDDHRTRHTPMGGHTHGNASANGF